MPLALEPLLALRPEPIRRFLRAALPLDRIALDALTAAGVPHYDGSDLLRRLDGAGEAPGGAWSPEARDAYRLLLDPPKRLAGLPDQERPREKALRSGIEALADDELLALLLRTGAGGEGVLELARRLLAEHDGLPGLAGRDVGELCAAHGLGPAKAAEIAAAFELGRRLRLARRRERPSLRTPEEIVAAIGPDLVALRHEELWCLPLDPRSCLLGEPRIVSRGDVDGTDAGPRAFFRLALAAGATSCIAVHNHPSGDASPSAADRAVTQRLVAAGRAIDLPLVDHLVIGDGGRFTSLRRSDPPLFR
jgi:DNA repair protein RadC